MIEVLDEGMVRKLQSGVGIEQALPILGSSVRRLWESGPRDASDLLEVDRKHLLNDARIRANCISVVTHSMSIENLRSSHGLDVGCKAGLKTAVYRMLGASEMTGCDVVEEGIVAGNDWANRIGEGARMRLVANSAASLPFPDASFDWVVAMGLIANLGYEAESGLLKEMCRVVKDGGVVLLHDSANPHHVPTREAIVNRQNSHESDINVPARKELLRDLLPNCPDVEIEELAMGTVGLVGADLEEVAARHKAGIKFEAREVEFGLGGSFPVHPVSGLPNPRFTDPKEIAKTLSDLGFRVSARAPLGRDLIVAQEADFSVRNAFFLVARK